MQLNEKLGVRAVCLLEKIPQLYLTLYIMQINIILTAFIQKYLFMLNLAYKEDSLIQMYLFVVTALHGSTPE